MNKTKQKEIEELYIYRTSTRMIINPVDPLEEKFQEAESVFEKTEISKHECTSMILGNDFFGAAPTIF
jgi:hypothetical protein